MSTTSREIHLVRRHDGMPVEADFSVVEQSVPDVGEGEIQVHNLYLSIDPAMRPRLSAGQALNEAMGGGAIGRVVQSRNPNFKEATSSSIPGRSASISTPMAAAWRRWRSIPRSP